MPVNLSLPGDYGFEVIFNWEKSPISSLFPFVCHLSRGKLQLHIQYLFMQSDLQENYTLLALNICKNGSYFLSYYLFSFRILKISWFPFSLRSPYFWHFHGKLREPLPGRSTCRFFCERTFYTCVPAVCASCYNHLSLRKLFPREFPNCCCCLGSQSPLEERHFCLCSSDIVSLQLLNVSNSEQHFLLLQLFLKQWQMPLGFCFLPLSLHFQKVHPLDFLRVDPVYLVSFYLYFISGQSCLLDVCIFFFFLLHFLCPVSPILFFFRFIFQ